MLLKFSLNIWCPKINENHCTCISRATNQPFRPFVARHSSNLSILLEPTRYHGIKASSRQQAVRAIVTTRYLPKRQRIARTDEIKRHPWRCTSVVVANRRVSTLYRLGIISATARRKWREHPRAASLTYRRRKSPTHPRRVNPLAFPTLLFSPSSPPRGRFSAASGVTRGKSVATGSRTSSFVKYVLRKSSYLSEGKSRFFSWPFPRANERRTKCVRCAREQVDTSRELKILGRSFTKRANELRALNK